MASRHRARTAPAVPLPADDPFHRPPPTLAALTPGTVVGVRAARLRPGWLRARVRAWQLSYRSTDHTGRAILAVTTLVVPHRRWREGPRRPLVAYGAAQDNVADAGTPSYALVARPMAEIVPYLIEVAPYLASGWAVCIADHQGPQSLFGVGRLAGQVMLDGIRAIRSAGLGGIDPATPCALAGYSGGARACGWAAQLHPTYAPEQALAGVAVGGTVADLVAVDVAHDGKLGAGLTFALAESFDRAYPDAGIAELLDERGRASFAQLRADGGMTLPALLARFRFRRLADETVVDDLWSQPPIAPLLEANRLGRDAAPIVPVFSHHVRMDEVVPVAQHDALVRAWRSHGAQVQVVRPRVGNHIVEGVARAPAVRRFLAARFTGEPFEPSG